MDDTGTHLANTIKEQLDKGLKPRLVFDNFDFRVSSGELLKGVTNSDRHWICQYLTFDRVDSSHLDNTKPQGELKNLEIKEYLLTEDEQRQIRKEYIVLVARILTEYIPWLEQCKKCVPKHIDHPSSQEMRQKSVVISLPVMPFNQNKHSEVIQYLDSVENFLKEIHGNSEDGTPLQLPLGGDLLGRERVTGAKKLRRGCDNPEERFDNIVEASEYWHAKQSILSVSL